MFEFIKNGEGQILNTFFISPQKEYYLREIARILDKEAAYCRYLLNKLVKEGFLIDEKRGNLRFFRLNTNHPLYEEVRRIIFKTIGIENQLKDIVKKFPQIKLAFIFGSLAKDNLQPTSDIDLMLIGKIDPDKLIEKITKLEAIINREISYQVYTKSEVIKKLKIKDSYFWEIFNSSMIIIKGDINEFKRLLK